jgi:Family of unknown function (DUF6065)
MFKPAGSIKTANGRRKLRACPNCNSDEWSRLVTVWVREILRLPRQARILALSAPLALRAALVKIAGASFIDAETPDLAGGAFAQNAFDIIVMGENWTYESNNISIALKLHEALRDKGWLVILPLNEEDAQHKLGQLNKLGFRATVDPEVQREPYAVDPGQPFLAAQKIQPQKAISSQLLSVSKDEGHLIWYREDGPAPEIRPAPLAREWMDATPEKFAYRCLPLNIANSQGWELLSQHGFTATWSGGAEIDAIKIVADEVNGPAGAMSHFGSGILTFGVTGLFRTPGGIDLCATGPINRPKAGIQALTGIIETDWSEFGFTMNWIFTDRDRPIRFEKGEPYCTICPVPRGLAESMEPVIVRGEESAELWRKHMAHRMSRTDFNNALKVSNSPARLKGWQRSYFVGPDVKPTPDHRTKVKLKPFRYSQEG